MARGQSIPIFLELRRVREGTALLDSLLATLSEFGLKLTADGFQQLASSGRILLLLDGFDEVREEEKGQIINQIEHLANANEGLRIIVSSRPHSGLEVSPMLRVLRLSDLQGDEYKAVIYKLLEDQKVAGDLIEQVQTHSGDVKELLKTPLLVTLLVINYKSFQEIPAHLSGFYDSLFKLLLQRHDGTKPGYRRQRLCSLNDTDYRLTFEAFCYLAKRHEEAILTHAIVYSTAADALKAISAKDDPEKYITDIVKITCLLVRDGEEYRFIHKSVQEYYAACFIKGRPDVVAQRVYEKILSLTQRGPGWRQELHFLSEIDAYRFRKFGLIPAVARYLAIAPERLSAATPEQAQPAVLNHLRAATMFVPAVPAEAELAPKHVRGISVVCDTVPTAVRECIGPLFEVNYSLARSAFERPPMGPRSSPSSEWRLNIGSAIDQGVLVAEIEAASLKIATSLLNIGKDAVDRNRAEEQDPFVLLPLD
jgi:hypothetical protein